MIRKTLKITGLLVVGYTIGETVTQWRLQPEPSSFSDFLKRYVATQKLALVDANAIGDDVLTGRTSVKTGLKDITFNKYPV